MTAKPTTAATPHSTRPDEVDFWIPKDRVLALGSAIPSLQARDDLSGKFARKVSYQKRAVIVAVEALNDERVETVKAHAERFPKFEKDGTTPHPKAGEFTPVYATKADGMTPLFKTDPNGNDTDERIIIPSQYNVVDVAAFNDEWKKVLQEFVHIRLPAMKVGELEAFKGISGRVMDSLVDIEEGSEYTVKPASWEEKPAPLALVPDTPTNERATTDATAQAEHAHAVAEADRSAP